MRTPFATRRGGGALESGLSGLVVDRALFGDEKGRDLDFRIAVGRDGGGILDGSFPDILRRNVDVVRPDERTVGGTDEPEECGVGQAVPKGIGKKGLAVENASLSRVENNLNTEVGKGLG